MPTYTPPIWSFPMPVTASRFQPIAPKWKPWNIQTDPARLGTWALQKYKSPTVAWVDMQTQLETNAPGRLGSGRAAAYRGYHVKGLGRTLAAANWNNQDDYGHNTGHLPPTCAFREYAITQVLRQRGLGALIAGCDAILLSPLTTEEARHLAAARKKEGKSIAPADATMMALSLKPAGFARHSNFVWSLCHFQNSTAWVGQLLQDLERLLAPPVPEPVIQGSPEALAAALDDAFERSFDYALQFVAHGLFWMYLQNNSSLDGRWLDLETPLFTGQPMVGRIMMNTDDGAIPQMAGFECYDAAASWRGFIRILDERLAFLARPGLLDHPAGTAFLRALRDAIRARFSRQSILMRDRELQNRALAFLSAKLGIEGRADRRRLEILSRYCFRVAIHGANEEPPELGWVPFRERPVPPSPSNARLEAAPFCQATLTPDASQLSNLLTTLDHTESPAEAFTALRRNGFVNP